MDNAPQSTASSNPRVRSLVAATTTTALSTHVDPCDDMRAERGRASFSPAPVSLLLHGGDEDKLKRT